MNKRAEIVERARQHVGHRETSNNRSKLIDGWLKRCGVAFGLAWCAAFASWCLGEVAIAGALNLGRRYPSTYHPQPGDLCYFATNQKGNGHIGIVLAVLSAAEVLVSEGNSANMVRIVRRLRSEVAFSRTREEDWEGPQPDLGPAERYPLVRVSFEGTR